MSGRTGKVKFDEKGGRKEVNLEILNLQNNSFRGVSILHCLTSLYGVLLIASMQNCWCTIQSISRVFKIQCRREYIYRALIVS